MSKRSTTKKSVKPVVRPVPDEEIDDEPIEISKINTETSIIHKKKSNVAGSKKHKPSTKKSVSKKFVPHEQDSHVEALNFKELVYEDINDDFAYGMFGPFKLVIDKATGYFNANKLANTVTTKHGGKKDFKEWKKRISSQDAINQVALSLGVNPPDLINEKSNLSNDLKGTYVHPKLIVSVAIWASPKFYTMANEIVTNFFIKRMRDEKDKHIEKQNITIKQKDNTISKMEKRINELMARLEMKQDEMNRKQDIVINQNKSLKTEVVQLKHKSDIILNVLEESSKDRVVQTAKKNRQHIIVVLKVNDLKCNYAYYVMRLMRKSLSSRMYTMKQEHKKIQKYAIIEANPNSMNVWHRITDKYTHNKDTVEYVINKDGNYFNVRKQYTINEFIDKIVEEYDQRLIDKDVVSRIEDQYCNVTYIDEEDDVSVSKKVTETDEDDSEEDEPVIKTKSKRAIVEEDDE